MIVYKFWSTFKKKEPYYYDSDWEGWFLFGLIPVYIRKISERKY